ncbi:MAG: DUF3881 family protein [Lachnospiraceae bacterium]|nr:DUF3881 family protein [Lachnospiraceae bacterium]MDD6619092.1 DUF3881 family protein [Clostridiales bacterium]
MHSFLRSIGFSEMKTKKDLDIILNQVMDRYDEKVLAEAESGQLFAQISKDYGCDMGISVCGEYDENDEFQMEYYFPYFKGTGITTQEKMMVERHAGTESYAGACDDVRIGVTVIFYLQNGGEYKQQIGRGCELPDIQPVTLTGLAREGKILLPVQKDKEQVRIEQEATRTRNQLMLDARSGDEEAIENLTMEDMDTYSMVCKRIQTEDVFSIVDSYFMPYGIECDQYNVMGEIMDCSSFRNTYTGEEIFQITLSCNDMQFDVCINAKDMLGEPAIGRRFKGIIWLQGQLHF